MNHDRRVCESNSKGHSPLSVSLLTPQPYDVRSLQMLRCVPPPSQAPKLWRFRVLQSPRGLSKPIRNRKDKIHSHKSRGQDEASQRAAAGGPRGRAARTYPSAGVADELDEEGWQLGSADLGGRAVGHRHEALRAGFSHPPNIIWAELKKFWDLPKQIKPCYSNLATLRKGRTFFNDVIKAQP